TQSRRARYKEHTCLMRVPVIKKNTKISQCQKVKFKSPGEQPGNYSKRLDSVYWNSKKLPSNTCRGVCHSKLSTGKLARD
ncbi:MAG: hypothetical protein WBN40_11255, partial [Pseudomonadales bacterium]